MTKKKILLLALLLVVLGLGWTAYSRLPDYGSYVEIGSKYDVRILRDEWGVPHVFGKTDADAAYGLAYAHAEDDFATIQEGMLLVRGQLASVQGQDAAPSDYLVKLLKIRELVDEKYETDLSPMVRDICEAYADGLNCFAAKNRDLVVAPPPFTGKDVVAGFVFKGPFFYGLDGRIKEIFGDKRRREVSQKTAGMGLMRGVPIGSNAFAVSPKRTPDGKTHLAINSHQPWEGPVAWYEAHIHSEEGWNTVGGTFPGVPVILLGHNENLGWAHTVNKPDLADIYVLDINPENPDQYRLDGEWRDLEVRQVGIKVKLWGPISWTFKREALWSEYGATVRQDHGVYAIRYGGREDIRQVEQWYRMNKAKDFGEWESAMKMRAIPSLNAVYADRDGRIAYVYNARFPIRAEGYDWKRYLPGNTSETLWTEYLPYENLPQCVDPESGFVVSCNQTPYRVTVASATKDENPNPDDFSPTLGIETHLTNRSLRALELFGGDDSITEEDFFAYKYDDAYSTESDVARIHAEIAAASDPDDPLLKECLETLRGWDLRANRENTAAAISLLSIQPNSDGGYRGGSIEEILGRMKKYGAVLKEKHGRVDVPWGEVNRVVRGEVDLPVDGAADVLRALYSVFERDGGVFGFEDGTVEGKGGDCYFMMTSWDKEGNLRSQSIHQFGAATLDKDSPHYSDQSVLFAKKEMKPVWLEEEDIRRRLEREYRPGE